MLNKRLLIKNLLAHQDENSFFDKKRQLNLHIKDGKAKFVKHICALSNSNPHNNSYLLVGFEDETNEIIGTDFYDDSHIQNLVNAFLEHPPKIQYENIVFPHLSNDKVVGLITIFPKRGISFFKKKALNIREGTVFSRIGSTTVPEYIEQVFDNKEIVESIEKNSRNSMKEMIDHVVTFLTSTHQDMRPKYHVFKEYFIVCWAGKATYKRGQRFLSRVDIALINEQLKLFYSALDEVTIEYNEDEFIITEFVKLGLKDSTSHYPFSRQTITFNENITYKIQSELIFSPPKYNQRMLHHIYNSNLALLNKLHIGQRLSESEEKDMNNLCHAMMICYLNGFKDAKRLLIEYKHELKNHENKDIYISFKEVMRILRKLKYETINE
ncbi:ATP-binding protein [Myroides ceti]|uniref:ATP-binding protein n=1 Tax=Paenimyroides ceti TaxID=395087 RepID=A0ABT8CZP2_9FLAO|nr:ATP-binding protein [Paenimyroides ceti]MDN3708532.1 ATP-binding protein [Paenimyroides ceti]